MIESKRCFLDNDEEENEEYTTDESADEWA